MTLRWTKCMVLPALAGLGAAMGTPVAAACLDEVNAMAERHQVSTTPPSADAKGGDVSSRELSRSGGVVRPPPVGDPSVVAPPAPSADRMPTLPDVAAPKGGTTKEDAVQRASLQSLLIAARAQAERGQETQCLDRLAKARELLARSK